MSAARSRATSSDRRTIGVRIARSPGPWRSCRGFLAAAAMEKAAGNMPSGLTGLKIDKGKIYHSPGANSKSQPISFVDRELVGLKQKLVGLLQLIHRLSTAPPGWRQLARHIRANRMPSWIASTTTQGVIIRLWRAFGAAHFIERLSAEPEANRVCRARTFAV